MNEALELAAGRVSEYLGTLGLSQINDTTFVAKRGSAVIGIRIFPWESGEDAEKADAMVQVSANVVEGATLTSELMRDLLAFNHETAWGAFGITSSGLITYHHCLLGSTLAKEELLQAVYEVAKVSDDWDDVIVEQAGGRTAIDKLRAVKTNEEQPTIEPPAQEG